MKRTNIKESATNGIFPFDFPFIKRRGKTLKDLLGKDAEFYNGALDSR